MVPNGEYIESDKVFSSCVKDVLVQTVISFQSLPMEWTLNGSCACTQGIALFHNIKFPIDSSLISIF